MNCRTAITAARPRMPTARERLEHIHQLSDKLLSAIEEGATKVELCARALDIQGVACIGAAYERRRERGE